MAVHLGSHLFKGKRLGQLMLEAKWGKCGSGDNAPSNSGRAKQGLGGDNALPPGGDDNDEAAVGSDLILGPIGERDQGLPAAEFCALSKVFEAQPSPPAKIIKGDIEILRESAKLNGERLATNHGEAWALMSKRGQVALALASPLSAAVFGGWERVQPWKSQ